MLTGGKNSQIFHFRNYFFKKNDYFRSKFEKVWNFVQFRNFEGRYL